MSKPYVPPDPLLLGRSLDPIDQRIMTLLGRGHSPQDIGQILRISHHSTLQSRLQKIRGKLGAKTMLEAMYIWTRSTHQRSDIKQMLLDMANGITDDCE